jgi:hypothetical protein
MMTDSDALDRYLGALTDTFRRARDKHEAHFRSRGILGEMAVDSAVIPAIFAHHLRRQGTLNWKHYPVVSIELMHNAYYTLVANCWIPLPGRETDVSTKAIHHHGNMLLTTATGFGPGYEHWTFTRPEVVDPERELYRMDVLEHAPHPHAHIAFVDAFIAHCPLYPPALSVTFALWSNQFPTTWLDVVKRWPLLRGREAALRRLAARVGLTGALDLKIIQYFDFFPTRAGFKGMKERIEFALGPNEHYLQSLFHMLQATGSEHLATLVRDRLAADTPLANAAFVRSLLGDLQNGRPIDAKLSDGHYNVDYANFRRADITEALTAQSTGAPRTIPA